MRKLFSAAMAFALAVLVSGSAWGESMVFLRPTPKGEFSIFRGDLSGNAERLVAGFDPEISPDGSKVAYTHTDSAGNRYIAVYDTQTKTGQVIKNITGTNNYGPRWSQDGKQLLFSRFTSGSFWIPVIYNMERGKSRELYLHPHSKETSLFSPFWSRDGLYVFTQDLYRMYRFSAKSGQVEKVVSMDTITKREDSMVDSGMTFTDSGKAWLFVVSLGNEECEFCLSLPGGMPMKGAVYAHYPGDGRTVRLTPKEWCASSAAWLGGESGIVFSGHRADKKAPKDTTYLSDIYRMSIADKKPALLIKNGQSVSTSAQ